MAGEIIPTVILGLAILLVLLFNIFFLVVFIRRKRLRTPRTAPISMLLLHLAFIDVISALLWTLYTLLSAAGGEWFISEEGSLSTGLCKQQVYIMMFCNIITAHTLMALMFERFLWIFKPSKHQEIVFDFVILLFLLTLYIFDGGIATFTLWGFGKAVYFSDQYQCAVDYAESVSHLNFTFAMHFWIPIIVIAGLYIAIMIRVIVLKRRRVGNGPIVLEENLQAVGDSYAERLKMQYAKFQGAGAKSVKPTVKDTKVIDDDGFQSDSDEFNSSDEEKSKNDDVGGMSRDYRMKKKKRGQKKIYTLSRSDVREAHMYALISFVYFACWIPYIVRSIIWTYYFYEMEISVTFTLVAVCASHFCSCFKVPFYFLSDRMRGAFLKTIRGKKDPAKFDNLKEEKPKSGEVTTEL